MAKKETKVASWDDFSEDSLLNPAEEGVEEQEEEVEEEIEEEKEVKPVKKGKKVAVKASKPAPEEEQEEEQEEEVEVEEPKDGVEEEPKEDEVPTGKEFFEQVEKLTGLELDVDYGDTDPLTPQGVAIREKAVREAAVDNFLEEIETNYPAAFKALQHAYNGGDLAELFKTTTSRDYSKVTLGENDKDLAKQILTEYYQSKGVKNEAKIKRMLESDEESEGGIVGEAKSALEEMKTEQTTKADEVLVSQKAKSDEQKKRDQIMVSALDEVLEAGKLGTFKLTGRSEASEFKKFALQSLRRTGDGKYEFATPVDSANLEKLLQYQYFQFKGGDLSKLIQVKAATENAKKFRLKAAAESGVKKGSSFETAADKAKQGQSLKDYDV